MPPIITKQLQSITVRKRLACEVPIWIRYDDEELLSEYIQNAYVWCISTFGIDDIYTVPYFEWTIDDDIMRKFGMLGEYDFDGNSIVIRVRGHRTWRNLASTVIHEYVHYLQNKAWYERYWNKLESADKATVYDKHPYEIEANYIGMTYSPLCSSWAYAKAQRISR